VTRDYLTINDVADELGVSYRQAYLLVRAYADLAELESSQAHFYASAAWREGPREAVLACMASSTSVVLKLPQAALDAWLPNPAPQGTPDEHTQPAA